jgi:hypothetical protein
MARNAELLLLSMATVGRGPSQWPRIIEMGVAEAEAVRTGTSDGPMYLHPCICQLSLYNQTYSDPWAYR